MTPREYREQILTDIAAHLRVHGRRDWEKVRNQYPDVLVGPPGSAAQRKFWRYVKIVTDASLNQMAERRAGPPDAPVLAHLDDAVQRATREVTKHLPVAPPPSYLAADGARAHRQIDAFAAISQIWDDVLLAREFALDKEKSGEMKTDAKGRSVIKNPVLFDGSIKRRIDVLETMMRIRQEVWDLERNEAFYNEIISIIVDEIGGAHPEIQRRIMNRLKVLNDARGMTVHADPLGTR